ncbi:MAG: hypothetical protein E2600_04830, partial [Chryseobacterium sp.]|nr:hypothetical protein [Chryseobacterium sp.]
MMKTQIMRRKNFILLIIFIITENLYCQITPPAPTPNGYINTLMITDTKEPSVARFQEYSFVPVDLYAGKAKIEIPFFEIKLGDLKIPIALEYNTQGIQINSMASRVGTGWVLNTGGNVGKSIKEVNDFSFLTRIFNGSGGTSGMPLDCAGSLGHPLRVGWKYRNTNVCVSTIPMPVAGPNNIDISPDVYTVAAPGLQTRFFYPDSTVPLESNINQVETTSPVEIEPTDSKFSSRIKDVGVPYPNDPNFPSFFQNIPANKRWVRDYFDFDIIHNGYEYTFNDYDISYLDSPYSFYQTGIWGADHPELNWDISAWHLNKIENVNTKKKVEFVYESVPYYITSKLLYKYFLDQPKYGNYIEPPAYNNVQETNVHIAPKRLKTIISDEAIIKFQYNHPRKDLIGDYALTNIQIYTINNQLVKEYRLNYYYMNDNGGDGSNKRLFLDYIEEIGANNTSISKYYLSYYDGTLPNSNSTNQSDWYGYYKKNTNGGDRPILYMNTNLNNFSILPVELSGIETFSLRGNRSIYPDPNDMKVGMLKKIMYPTGGYTKLDYEANRFRINNQEILGGGLRILNQELSDLNTTRKLKYIYQENDGLTSGYVNNVPSYGYLASEPSGLNGLSHQQKQDFLGGTFLTMIRSLISVDKTQNTYVGYSKVKEEEVGKGYVEYQYYSPKEYPSTKPIFNYIYSAGQYVIDNTAFPFLDIYTNLDVRTGN